MMFGLVRSCASGDSCFATFLTRSKPSVSDPPAGMVPVAAPSNEYGTSAPGVFRPSARVYSTWYRVMVTSLLVVGATPLTTFLSGARRTTDPVSPKIVGHGAAVVQGAGEVTLVITSETRIVVPAPGVAAPREPVSESITRKTGDLLSRTTSPHERLPAASAARSVTKLRLKPPSDDPSASKSSLPVTLRISFPALSP